MKNQIFTGIGLGLIGIALTTQAAFPDVPNSHPHFNAINYMKDNGIIEGYQDQTFRPNNTINRAEFTKIVISNRFSLNDIKECTTSAFLDVPTDSWFAPYVCVAYTNNIISGYKDGTFRPSDPINFVEAAKIITIASAENQSSYSYYDDKIGPWYYNYLIWLKAFDAIPIEVQSLNQKISRGVVSEIIYRTKFPEHNKPSLTYDLKQNTLIEIQQPTSDFLIWSVGPHKIECGGWIGECLMVDEQLFSDVILGFDHKPGYTYKIKVEKQAQPWTYDPLVPPLADASDYTYQLIDIISETPVKSEATSNEKQINVVFTETKYQQLLNNGNKFVLNFHADWCPSCQKLDKTLQAQESDLPNGTVVLKVDYDDSTALKKEFGVTSQTTGVFFENGTMVKLERGLSFDDIKDFF